MTRLQLHILQWKDCTLCHYSENRKRTVLGKGKIPCDILFVGEGPADSEDVSGDPFDGQAGRLLDTIIEKSGAAKYRVAFNNLVACYSLDPDTLEKEDPDHDCIMACKPRLEEYVKIANPKLIVAVGKQSNEYLDQTWKDAISIPQRDDDIYTGPTPIVHIQHPASILRRPFIARPELVKMCCISVRNGIETYITGERRA